jgi:hypothetical protein
VEHYAALVAQEEAAARAKQEAAVPKKGEKGFQTRANVPQLIGAHCDTPPAQPVSQFIDSLDNAPAPQPQRTLTTSQAAALVAQEEAAAREKQHENVPHKGQQGFQKKSVVPQLIGAPRETPKPPLPPTRTPTQKAVAAVKQAGALTADTTTPAPKDRHASETTAKRAKRSGTNRQYVADAKKIRTSHPEQFKAIETGEWYCPTHSGVPW